VLGQAIFQDELCFSTSETITVCLNEETQKSQPISDDLRLILEGAAAK
jgi:acyl-CoA thioesterase FadM